MRPRPCSERLPFLPGLARPAPAGVQPLDHLAQADGGGFPLCNPLAQLPGGLAVVVAQLSQQAWFSQTLI
jgi:hypothetical protein